LWRLIWGLEVAREVALELVEVDLTLYTVGEVVTFELRKLVLLLKLVEVAFRVEDVELGEETTVDFNVIVVDIFEDGELVELFEELYWVDEDKTEIGAFEELNQLVDVCKVLEVLDLLEDELGLCNIGNKHISVLAFDICAVWPRPVSTSFIQICEGAWGVICDEDYLRRYGRSPDTL
jgi:hypothetical protein